MADAGSEWAGEKGRFWAEHADWFSALLADFIPTVVEGAAFGPGERVLDVGCGGGDLSMAAAGAVGPGGSVLGVDLSADELLIERTPRIRTFFAAEILDPYGPYDGRAARWIPDVVKACTGPVYLTFDCDGLDPSIVPALGTPEPGGLGWYDTLNLVRTLADGPGIIGLDVSEIAPIEGFAAPQFSIARLIYRMLGLIHVGRRRSSSVR